MRTVRLILVPLVLATSLSGCSAAESAANKPFNGDCSIVADVVARVTLQLSVLPAPGAEYPTSEEDVRQRLTDGGWSTTVQYWSDLNNADSHLVRNEDNYTSAEKRLISDYEAVVGDVNSSLVVAQGQTETDWNNRLEDSLRRMSTALDKLSAACKA